MFSLTFFLLNLEKSPCTCRLQLYTYEVVFFFSSAFYMLWTTKVWIGRDYFSAERQSLKTLRVLVLWWNGKQMCTSCNFLFLFIIFFEITLEPLCHAKQNNKYIFNHPPTKTQGWPFVWQNGYGRSTFRLVCSDFMSIFFWNFNKRW